VFAESVSGFIAPRNNDDGIVLPNPKHGKKDDRSKVKQQKAVRQKYVFVKASKRGQRHRDYFNPNSAVQLRVMGMEDTVVRALPQPTELLLVYLVAGCCSHVAEPYLTPCAPQNRASKPTDRTPQVTSSLGEASNGVMGPDITSVDPCRKLVDP
jgi:hypothetical protein